MTTIRLANVEDVAILAEVEKSASTAFRILPDYIPSERTVPAELLIQMTAAKNLWVAVDNKDVPVGFIGCKNLDNIFYIHEISVSYAFQKQGIGRRLIQTVFDESIRRGLRVIGLTTSRHVPWNMPFYKRLGFEEVVDSQKWPSLISQLHHEISKGADPSTRCAMAKVF